MHLQLSQATSGSDRPGALSVDVALALHGAEILGWLAASLPTEAEVADAYSLFCEELWRSLPRYRAQCSLRTWCYMLARHVLTRVIARRRSAREIPISRAPVSDLAQPVREPTTGYRCTAVKQRVRALREQLDPDDQMLLVLRVDKDLDWREIAHVFLGEHAEGAELVRRAAALRKRFERVKARLRALAAADALEGSADA